MIKVTIKNSVDSKDLNLDAKIVQPVVRDLAQIVYDETQEGTPLTREDWVRAEEKYCLPGVLY